jgi:hypothetical protein
MTARTELCVLKHVGKEGGECLCEISRELWRSRRIGFEGELLVRMEWIRGWCECLTFC